MSGVSFIFNIFYYSATFSVIDFYFYLGGGELGIIQICLVEDSYFRM